MLTIQRAPSIYRAALFLILYFWMILFSGCSGARVEAMPSLKALPSLEQILEMSETRTSSFKPSLPVDTHPGVALEVQRNYDLILARREQLEVSHEVKGHFEKAVTQAEKKFEEGEGDISQSALTKLKLGLAGTLNDISQFNSDIALAQLRLEQYLGVEWVQPVDISGPKFQPMDFSHSTVAEYQNSNPSGLKTLKSADLFNLKEAIIEVNKAREQLTLAAKNRKMTRALLVTEAANYDFGIGNEADLFEALIIYTRVLVGYYETIHTFNVAVHRFHSLNQVK